MKNTHTDDRTTLMHKMMREEEKELDIKHLGTESTYLKKKVLTERMISTSCSRESYPFTLEY